VQVRIGFDLEPALPDPAPAFADPDGALHPALLEGLAALPLQSYPTQSARSALVSQVLSEPGRPDLKDPQDPFLAIYRHAVRQDMEPEVTGNLALLLIRGQLAQVQRQHRQQLPDPAEALLDPNNDPWKNRRARLQSTNWEDLWAEVKAAATQCSDVSAFAFEGINLRAARRWLQMYRLWWEVAAQLSDTETCPEQPSDLDQLEASLQHMRRGCAVELQLDDKDPSSASLLRAAIELGITAEAAFVEATGNRPGDVLISARWLLNQQLRSLRHIALANREHFLHLHELLRTTDVARVAVQVAYRAALIELWLADARGLDTADLETALISIPDPTHQSTIGAALGRVLGAVLVRRLRRGRETGALPLAERALQLAPEELAVRMAWNDLGYQHRAGWDARLLSSLRAEHDRWESLPVLIMGSRVAAALGDNGRVRWFREHLVPRALNTIGFGPWAVLVMESLASAPSPRVRLTLERLEETSEDLRVEPDAATWVLFGSDDRALLQDSYEDLRRAVIEALDDIEEADNLVPTQLAGPRKKSQGSAWQQLVQKALPETGDLRFAGAAWARIQSIRAAAPDLRRAPVAGQVRKLQELLSRAADILEQQIRDASEDEPREDSKTASTIAVEIAAACSALAELLPQTHKYLRTPSEANSTHFEQWLRQQMDPLRVAVREPRARALVSELNRLTARARAQENHQVIELGTQLRARISRAQTAADAESRFAEADKALTALRASLYSAPEVEDRGKMSTGADNGVMTLHADFESFSCDELGMLPDAFRRALEMVRLFNLSGGRRDRKRLKGKKARELFELRHRTAHTGGLRVFYQRHGRGWQALAAMSKYDDRQQRDAIERVRLHFQTH